MSASSMVPTTGLLRSREPRAALRLFLGLDAVVTGGNGLAYAVASGPLGRFLGLGPGLLLGLGLTLIAYAAGVGLIAARRQPSVLPVRAVVEVNLAWAVLSLLALLLWFEPSTVGAVWIVLQAATVAAFAALQYTALKAMLSSWS
ncbi:hypothetical protein [Streptomyces sp. KLOTTS4A1]|uniref:hypothetical protein n=1 Tax=Streptomyces sp. KLOTTS4A1 TaxID=3390996 RepID=UPI0039F603CD